VENKIVIEENYYINLGHNQMWKTCG
jgi:hypothetical protein